MDQKQIINHRQAAWLTAAVLTGGGLISIQQALIRIARMDAWFCYLLPTLYVIAVSYVFGYLVQRFPGKHLFEITKIVFGRLAGTLVNLVLLFHMWLILVRDLNSFGKFIGISLLPNTPDDIIVLLLVVLLMYYGKTSIEVIARVNDLFFPLFALTAFMLPLMLSNEADSYLIQPLLTSGPLPFWEGNGVSLGWYGDIFVMGAFLHTLWETKQIRSSLRHGLFLASLILGIFLLMEVLVLGPVISGNLLYPNYNLVQQIHVTDFLDRADLLILSIWFPVTACEVIVIYLAFLTGISSLVKQREYTSLNTPVALLILVTTLLAFQSTSEVSSFRNYSSPVLVLCYQPLLFVLLWLLARRYPIQENPVSGQEQSGTQAANAGGSGANSAGKSPKVPRPKKRRRSMPGQGNPASNLLKRLSLPVWERSSNLIFLIGLACVFTGMWTSRYYPSLGIACGIAYGLCAVLVTITSYMELVTAQYKEKR